MIFKFLLLISISLFTLSCTAPRAIKDSGQVTEKGKFKIGIHTALNISTSTTKLLSKDLIQSLEDLIAEDTIVFDSTYTDYSKGVLAYSLDPFSMSNELYIFYGIYKNFDIGFSYSNGNPIYQIGYQFLGASSESEKENTNNQPINGTFALQYSSQEYELPSYFGTIQGVLGYHFERTDYLAQFRFSNSLGPSEKYGALSYGGLLGYTSVSYGFDTRGKIIKKASGEILDPIPEVSSNSFNYGAYVNAKLGYKWVYLIMGLTTYYQDYGQLEMLNNEKIKINGFIFAPSFGLQFYF